MSAWDYLEAEPSPDAPISDNPSGLYCSSCRLLGKGFSHCNAPEYCGGMRRMKPRSETAGRRASVDRSRHGPDCDCDVNQGGGDL